MKVLTIQSITCALLKIVWGCLKDRQKIGEGEVVRVLLSKGYYGRSAEGGWVMLTAKFVRWEYIRFVKP
jgi:hypothetical protein